MLICTWLLVCCGRDPYFYARFLLIILHSLLVLVQAAIPLQIQAVLFQFLWQCGWLLTAIKGFWGSHFEIVQIFI